MSNSKNLTEKQKSFLDKYFDESELKILFPVLAIAFLVRVIFILEIQDTFFLTYLTDDAKIYNDWAMSMIKSGAWTMDSPFFMAPAYPYFLRIVYGIFGHSIFLVQIFQAFANVLTLVFTYLAIRNFAGKNTAFVGTIVGAFYLNYIFYSGIILSETLQVLVYSVILYYLTFPEKDERKYYYLELGFLVALAAWFRGNVLLFAGFLTLYFLYRATKNAQLKNRLFRQLGFFYAGLIIVIAPLTLHNVLAGGDFVLLTSNGGINFYIGNNEKAVGVFVTPSEFDYYEDMAGHKYAQKILNKKLSPSEASSYWYGRGLDFIKQNPGKYFLLELKKLMLFFGEDEEPQSSGINPDYYAENYSKILNLPLFGFFFLFVFSIPGIFFAIKQKKDATLITLFSVSFVVASILFFVNGRFRMAITPFMILFAAYGIVEIFEVIKKGELKLLKTPAIILLGFVIVYYFVIDRPVFKPYDALLSMGNKEYEEGNYEKAIEHFKKSLFYRDFYLTYVNLGNSYAQLKDFKNAVAAYNLAINRKPDYYLAHFNLGFAYTQMNNWDKAIEEYKIALRYKPDFAEVYRNIGIVYYVNEKWEDALYYFQKYLSYSTDKETNELVKKDIETIKLKIEKSKE